MATSLFAYPVGIPVFRAFDTNGDPLSGGTLATYEAGTSTPKPTYPTYSDAINGVSANTNPVQLDSLGEAQVWAQVGFYKFVLSDSDGNVVNTQDYVAVANGYPYPPFSAWVNVPVSLLVDVYLSPTSFQLEGDYTGTLTAQRRVKTTNTGGTRYSTVVSSSFDGTFTTVVVVNDSGSLDSGLSAVWYGVEPYTSPAYLSPRTALCMIKNGDQTGFATATKVATWTADVDALSEWSASDNRWVAKFPGNYLVTISAEMQDPVPGSAYSLQLYKGGVSVRQAVGRFLATTNYPSTVSLTTVITMAAGEYLEMFIAATVDTLVESGNNATLFNVSRIP